ncbi:proteoglycan 4-like [Hemicordylus capensis]|uniref:proteoglycan 4-like n=1 Tax=Hemicordylus capensis TaxID=884348 RepID=UPI0023028139|nr:proteoglycan 4-like [Hemicordylus capensis]
METKTTFKRCVRCRAKLPSTDHHDSCLLCLGEEHNTGACKICCAFSKQTRTNRALRLRAALYEDALRPPTPRPETLSTSASGREVHGAVDSQSKTVSTATPFKRPLQISSKEQKRREKRLRQEAAEAAGTGHSNRSEHRRETPSPSSVQASSPVADATASQSTRTPSASTSKPPPASTSKKPSTSTPSTSTPSTSKPSTSKGEQRGKDRSAATPSTSKASKTKASSTSRPSEDSHLRRRHSLSPAHTPQQSPSTPRQQGSQRSDGSATSALRKLMDSGPNTPAESTFQGFLSAGLDDEEDDEEAVESPPPPKTPSLSPRAAAESLLQSPMAVVQPLAGVADGSIRHPTSQPEHTCGFRHSLPHDYAEYLRWKAMQPALQQPVVRGDVSPAPGNGEGVQDTPREEQAVPVRAPQDKPSGKRKRKSTPPPPSPSSKESSPTSTQRDFESDYSDSDHASRQVEPSSEVPPRLSRSPTEELKAYHSLIREMAEALGLDLQLPETESADPVYNMMFQSKSSHPVSLPMIPAIAKAAKSAWDSIQSANPTSKRIENLYRILDEENTYLLRHPDPNSMVVDCASTSKGSRRHTTPADKEGRKIDVLGRRLYATSSLAIRIANYAACMARYTHLLWDNLLHDSTSMSPGELQVKLHEVFDKTTSVTKQQLSTFKHLAETESRAMVTAVTMRRHAWLRATSLQGDMKDRVENLAFDGKGLFHETTDATMETLKKSKFTAKTFMAPTSAPSTRTYSYNKQRAYRYQDRRDYRRQNRPYQRPRGFNNNIKSKNQSARNSKESTKQSF